MLKIFANALLSFILLSSAFFVSGQSYFQQEVDYVIEVSLNDETHTLDGKLTLTYTNNSPNTLNEIYFHLWPNAYKNTETALAKQFLENGEIDFHYATESARGFITNLDFKSKGVALKLEPDPKHIDIARLVLNSPLRPGESITMNTPFMVKIPDGQFSRLGHEEQAYQVTQWYPKPAVYDKDGWHAMPYLNQGEFYSEFGSFDVTITLPKNYVVGATGDLQTKSEIEWMNKRALLTSRTKEFDLNDLSFPESSKEQKTIRFTQKNVHDFAWFADKRFHVLKDTIKLPHSGREVTTWALFTNLEANLWTRANEYINNGIYYYSLWNGDYPYNQMTAVESALSAGAGMEYPNITVIGESTTPFFLEVVIVHEVGHNWFYGILGSNERDHPWMDEGINTYNEIRYIELKHPNSGLLGLNEASILS
ncbi:MAG: M1 family metallopeptidase [Salibacteraceae bacterium]